MHLWTLGELSTSTKTTKRERVALSCHRLAVQNCILSHHTQVYSVYEKTSSGVIRVLRKYNNKLPSLSFLAQTSTNTAEFIQVQGEKEREYGSTCKGKDRRNGNLYNAVEPGCLHSCVSYENHISISARSDIPLF